MLRLIGQHHSEPYQQPHMGSQHVSLRFGFGSYLDRLVEHMLMDRTNRAAAYVQLLIT